MAGLQNVGQPAVAPLLVSSQQRSPQQPSAHLVVTWWSSDAERCCRQDVMARADLDTATFAVHALADAAREPDLDLIQVGDPLSLSL